MKKMKGFIEFDGLYVLFILVVGLLLWSVYHTTQRNVKTEKIELQQEEFNKEYIKKNPDMIPVINAYSECKVRRYSVIEGCVEHVVKSDKEKTQLNNYLGSLADIYLKGIE